MYGADELPMMLGYDLFSITISKMWPTRGIVEERGCVAGAVASGREVACSIGVGMAADGDPRLASKPRPTTSRARTSGTRMSHAKVIRPGRFGVIWPLYYAGRDHHACPKDSTSRLEFA